MPRATVESPVRPVLAGRLARLIAKLIDMALTCGLLVFAIVISTEYQYIEAIIMLIIPVILMTQVVLLTKNGQTIGKKALNMRIVMVTTSQNGGFLRNVALRAWPVFFWVSFHSLGLSMCCSFSGKTNDAFTI
jgi:uncharacterized RDD family membrane protein YckC